MTVPFWLIIFSAIVPSILALAATIVSLINGSRIREVHLSLNSRLSELVLASKAQGRQDERDDQGKPR